jgi:pimeloyl-ACP methyl ester carboxylesterase
MIRRFLRNGYAVFSWDKPSSGESTGQLDEEHKVSQRAAILADGLQALAQHPAVDGDRIGLWGLSQAGWVMPLALELTDDVAFMIVVSGGGEDSIEQMAYQIGRRLHDNGGTAEQAALYEQMHAQFAKATTYEEYHQAMEQLLEIPDLNRLTGITFEMTPEDAWQPWPEEIGAFFDPMTIIEHTTIPMLVFFGEWDKLVDPVQGAAAYEAALQRAGNPDYQIVMMPHAGHVFTSSPDYLDILEDWLQHLAQ